MLAKKLWERYFTVETPEKHILATNAMHTQNVTHLGSSGEGSVWVNKANNTLYNCTLKFVMNFNRTFFTVSIRQYNNNTLVGSEFEFIWSRGGRWKYWTIIAGKRHDTALYFSFYFFFLRENSTEMALKKKKKCVTIFYIYI